MENTVINLFAVASLYCGARFGYALIRRIMGV